jgi:hypothetical protein
MRRHSHALVMLAGLGLCLGCLGEPEIEDRWTRLDIASTNIVPGQTLEGDSTLVRVQGSITYRSIITGAVVTEVRVSSTMTAGDVQVDPEAPRLEMARDIDDILQNSVTAGRAVRSVTGWDHLIQPIDLSFSARMPTMVDTSGTPLTPAGVWLVTYLGDEDEIELEDGRDSLVVTPFVSGEYEILAVGLTLGLTDAGTGGP